MQTLLHLRFISQLLATNQTLPTQMPKCLKHSVQTHHNSSQITYQQRTEMLQHLVRLWERASAKLRLILAPFDLKLAHFPWGLVHPSHHLYHLLLLPCTTTRIFLPHPHSTLPTSLPLPLHIHHTLLRLLRPLRLGWSPSSYESLHPSCCL